MLVVLKERQDFLRVRRTGVAWHDPCFILQMTRGSRVRLRSSGSLVNAEQGRCVWQVGFTASKKMVGGAVARNRAKRRMRAMTRCIMDEMAWTGFDYVLLAKRGILDVPWVELCWSLSVSVEKVHKKFLRWQKK